MNACASCLFAIALWQPAGITASSKITTAAVLSAMLSARGAESAQLQQAVEIVHVATVDGAYDATIRARGDEYRIDIDLGPDRYSFGRSEKRRWRRTPSGSVRIVRSDVQGDALDRWPRSIFGLDLSACDAVGETRLASATFWVVACRATGDPALFYYVDPSNGRVMREVSREGSRVVSYDFDDFRSNGSWIQPYHWRVRGADGDADVTVVQAQTLPVPAQAMDIPPTVPEQFALPADGVSAVPAQFAQGRCNCWSQIDAPVDIDGERRTFVIDTGTTQTIVDIGEAARLGLKPAFGHAVIPELRVGSAVAKHLSVLAVDLFHARIAGILGNEFFTGHIVHVDYAHQRIELISHSAFTPPAGATEIPADYDEGLPIVPASVGSTQGDRFALDTGSYWVLLSSAFVNRANVLPVPVPGYSTRVLDFLEGPVMARLEVIPSLSVGRQHFADVDAEIEQPSQINIDLPLDGILGANLLAAFDLWFDYDDGRLWLR
jgi:hypothetical protein